MRSNTIRQKWRQGKTTVGGWIWLPSTLSAEVMAHQEFDFLALDTQHGGMDFDSAFPVIQVISATDMPVLVRVGWNEPRLIMKYLDAGAFGIIVPMVNTADEAARAVAACRYPPAGMRSAGPFRAAWYAGSDYMSQANDEVLCIVMIETADAVRNLDDILAVPGVDCAYIGPSDLGASLGFPARYDPFEQPYRETFVRIRDSAKLCGVTAGVNASGGAQAARFIRDGFDFVTLTTDLGNMVAGTRAALDALNKGLATGEGRA